MSSTTSSGQPWDERYSGNGYAFGTEPNDFLIEAVMDLEAGDVLVLGDGEGRNGVYLASLGHRVVTVDLSPVGVAKAEKLAKERGVEINAHVTDLTEFDMGVEKWDAVVSIFCHLPSALRKQVHESVKRALRPGGIFILEAYNRANIGRGVGGPQSSDMTVELGEVEAEFSDWTIVRNVAVERQIEEGEYHSGLSSVTQFVVQRPAHLL